MSIKFICETVYKVKDLDDYLMLKDYSTCFKQDKERSPDNVNELDKIEPFYYFKPYKSYYFENTNDEIDLKDKLDFMNFFNNQKQIYITAKQIADFLCKRDPEFWGEEFYCMGIPEMDKIIFDQLPRCIKLYYNNIHSNKILYIKDRYYSELIKFNSKYLDLLFDDHRFIDEIFGNCNPNDCDILKLINKIKITNISSNPLIYEQLMYQLLKCGKIDLFRFVHDFSKINIANWNITSMVHPLDLMQIRDIIYSDFNKMKSFTLYQLENMISFCITDDNHEMIHKLIMNHKKIGNKIRIVNDSEYKCTSPIKFKFTTEILCALATKDKSDIIKFLNKYSERFEFESYRSASINLQNSFFDLDEYTKTDILISNIISTLKTIIEFYDKDMNYLIASLDHEQNSLLLDLALICNDMDLVLMIANSDLIYHQNSLTTIETFKRLDALNLSKIFIRSVSKSLIGYQDMCRSDIIEWYISKGFINEQIISEMPIDFYPTFDKYGFKITDEMILNAPGYSMDNLDERIDELVLWLDDKNLLNEVKIDFTNMSIDTLLSLKNEIHEETYYRILIYALESFDSEIVDYLISNHLVSDEDIFYAIKDINSKYEPKIDFLNLLIT